MVKRGTAYQNKVDRGMIYRQLRPVYWSPSTLTALAEAELEYREDHTSSAVYVKFPLVELGSRISTFMLTTADLPNAESIKGDDASVHAVIWTTTPWTIPANRVSLIV